jgi:hypothetical protein
VKPRSGELLLCEIALGALCTMMCVPAPAFCMHSMCRI